MAVVNVTIDPAVFTSNDGNTQLAGKIVGQATMTQPPLTIWPGPGDPDYPGKPPGGGSPPGIWPGPGDPDYPGGGKPPKPPDLGIWPGPGDPDFPGGGTPDPPNKPASPQYVWGFSPREGQWLQVYVPGEGEASPKDRR